MASATTEDPPPAYVDTVEEITRIYKLLPPRPSIEEVEAANSVLQTVETEQNLQLEEISKLQPPQDVPPELFSVLQEAKKAMVSFRSHDQRKEAAQLLEVERVFQVFDGLVQKASLLVSGEAVLEKGPVSSGVEREIVISEESVESADRADVKVRGDLKGFSAASSSSKVIASSSGLNLIVSLC